MALRGSSDATAASASADTMDVDSLGSESDDVFVVGDTPVRPRPKLRTRRTSVAEEATSGAPDSPPIARPSKRVRSAAKVEVQYMDGDEDDAEEQQDMGEAYEDHAEQEPSEDERLPEEKPSRRRSGRARKKVQTVIDLSDEDFLASSDESDAKPKRAKKGKGKKAKGKRKRKRASSESESAASDTDDDSFVQVVGTSNAAEKDDSDGFIIDKVLAREVHTLKQWKKLCANKNTRFLTDYSIFLPDEEEEDKAEEDKTKEASAKDHIASPEKAAQTDADSKPEGEDENESNEVEEEEEERFLIKWKKLSYLHASWQTEKDLLETDKNAKGKIQRFRDKELRAAYSSDVQGDEYFNPEFRIVDRILDIRDRPQDEFSPEDDDELRVEGEKKLQYFLIKWKAQPYDQITWEREDDVGDDAAVQRYNERVTRAAKRFKKFALSKHTPSKNRRKSNFRGYTSKSPPPYKKEQQFQLRDYQLTGVNWMLFNWYQKRNSMLADEMGLGKTVQTVMYINHLAVVEQVVNPFIIIAPLSTLGHWQREFDSWTDLNAVVYHGSQNAREILQMYEFFLSEDELARAEELTGKRSGGVKKRPSARPKRNCYRFDVLITTYEMASAGDLSKLANINWQLMVVDEAHRLKNRSSKLSTILHNKFSYDNMLLLTGTPLQNNVEELWVLLNFLDEDKFRSKDSFLENFGELTDSSQVEHLHSELKPYLLRRMKEDVEKSLAPKEETIVEVELTVLQKQYYRAIYEKNTEFLSRGGRKGDTPSLMNVLMELRKCCNHPFLVKGVEDREVKRLSRQKTETKEVIQKQIRESLVDTSGKLVLLDKLLPRLKETGHRVLIFSQFKIMLDILQDYLALRAYNCERIDGNITGNERQSAIDRFCKEDSNAFIMLLSTRAGGVGINLTAADTVIIYDSDWNPQNDLQAQARCHRIGQKKSVKIYRLLTSKTYELHMFHQASLKLGLDQAVLSGIKNNDPAAKLKGAKKPAKDARMSKEEIENLLKHGAYEMFKEKEGEAEEASKKFGEESIDQILSRSTTIIHDPTRDADGNVKKNAMSSFSKATFVSSANPDEEVDIDDPNFWTKVVGLKGVEEQKPVEPSPLQKRRCRKVKSYVIDYDEEESTAYRKLFKKGKQAAVKDNDDYVVSDDDDDDDSSDGLVDDEFLGARGGAKKRKRTKPPQAPLHSHDTRIMDLLTTYGYGRWEDMQRMMPSLQAYPLAELKRYCQHHIAGMLRIVTAASCFTRLGLELEPHHVYVRTTAPPPMDQKNASPVDRFGFELHEMGRRYRLFPTLLKDLGTTNLLSVAIPVVLWHAKVDSRILRSVRSRLYQIENMFKLTQFVRLKFVPTQPLIALINDFQSVHSPQQIQDMIASGILPQSAVGPSPGATEKSAEVQPTSSSADTKPKPDVPGNGGTQVSKPSNESLTATVSPRCGNNDPAVEKKSTVAKSPSAGESEASEAAAGTQDVSAGEAGTSASPADVSASEAKSSVSTKNDSATSPPSEDTDMTEGSTSKTAPETAASSSDTPLTAEAGESKSEEATPEKEVGGAGSTPVIPADKSADHANTTSATTNDEASHTGNAEASETEDKAPKALDTAANKTANSDEGAEAKEKVGPTSSSAQDTVDSASATAVSATQSTADKELQDEKKVAEKQQVDNKQTEKELAEKKLAEREQAMKILQSLQDIGDAVTIAPWWISRVDDVLLMMYVCRDGWMKGRLLHNHSVGRSSLFGERSLRYSQTEWPTVAVLNKRLKDLITHWTAVKKPRAPQSVAAVLSATNPRAFQRQQMPVQQMLSAQQQRAHARSYNASSHGSRHNQFAKLIFSYGIPDVSTCRDPQERKEKWRYFLSDSQLGVSKQPLEELYAEAEDLERVCRVRLSTEVDSPASDISHENSILGGKRGIWMLTTAQCRRLLHRVELFRLLRTQILVLPPGQLVEVVSRVVRVQPPSTQYPVWWSSPRHDILLLQGVECYGLDEHLSSVWRLPLFNSANTVSPFPSTTWVENYVTTLAMACRNLLLKVRPFRPLPAERSTSSGSTDAARLLQQRQRQRQQQQHQRQQQQQQQRQQRAAAMKSEASETRRRIRDIRGMREEDPYFAPAVRLRQLMESNAVRGQVTPASKRESQASVVKPTPTLTCMPPVTATASAGASSVLAPAEETSLMQEEDPYVSERVQQLWIQQIKSDEIATAEKRATERREQKHGKSVPPGSDVIDLEEEEKAEAAVAASSAGQIHSSTSVGRGPASAAVAAAAQRRESATTSQLAVQPWDVIVIDDSDSD